MIGTIEINSAVAGMVTALTPILAGGRPILLGIVSTPSVAGGLYPSGRPNGIDTACPSTWHCHRGDEFITTISGATR